MYLNIFADNMIYYIKIHIFDIEGDIKMNYLSVADVAKKWNISQRRVQILCAENRIEGVFKLGETWAIPDDAEKPRDFRRKEKEE